MRVLGCLLMLVFLGFFLIASFGLSVLQIIMRMLGFDSRSRSSLHNEKKVSRPKQEPKKPVISDDEGEYVDFEEV